MKNQATRMISGAVSLLTFCCLIGTSLNELLIATGYAKASKEYYSGKLPRCLVMKKGAKLAGASLYAFEVISERKSYYLRPH